MDSNRIVAYKINLFIEKGSKIKLQILIYLFGKILSVKLQKSANMPRNLSKHCPRILLFQDQFHLNLQFSLNLQLHLNKNLSFHMTVTKPKHI